MAENDFTTTLSFMLGSLPQVNIGKHINNTNFLVGKKVFAFIKGDSVAIKLPKAKIQELVDKKSASPLVMGKRVMKEWAVIRHEEAEEYIKDLALFQESIAFVASKA